MSVFSKVGIKFKGEYLFYTVGKDSAVFLAIKHNKNASTIVIPEKIGKYIVRGISSLGLIIENMKDMDLSQNFYLKLYKALRDYDDITFFKSCTLPITIEYIGSLPEGKGYNGDKIIHDRFALPKNVSYIENSQISTKTLVLPKDIKYIGKVADSGTLENIFTEDESCDEGVPHYSRRQYRGENSKDELTYPKINKYAFNHCSNLKSIVLPDAIREIDDCAFSHIGSVEHFNFPKNLEKISDCAFESTNFTGTFNYPYDFPTRLENNNYNFEITGKITLEDFENLENMVNSLNSNGKSFIEFASEIDLSCLNGKLPDRAFCKKDLFSVKAPEILLGDNITEIGESAFEGNYISTLKLPSKLVSIGKNAFKDCPCLTKIELPDSLEIVEQGAFDTKCKLLIIASDETIERISNQKGYIEYFEKSASIHQESEKFIEKYKDYFDGKKANNAPKIQELVKAWTDYGQNPKIYQKLICALKAAEINKYIFKYLIGKAKFFNFNSEAEEFKKIMEIKVARLLQSNHPRDWLALYRLDTDNCDAVYKIVELLLSRYEKGAPKQLLRNIDMFMNTYRNNPRFSTLDSLYVQKVGNRGYEDHYWKLRMISQIEVLRILTNLDQVLIDACKKACEEKNKYAYILCDLAVAFSPDFKPPECPPRPKTENTKSENTASASAQNYCSQLFDSGFDFVTADATYTSSGSSSFVYTDEERRHAEEILSEVAAQKDAEAYVAYLLDDIDAPDNLDFLVEKFSGIDWSEYGDV